MRQLKLIAAAVMALAAITSIAASTASGAQAEGFLPKLAGFFIGEGKGGKLESLAGTTLTCTATKIDEGSMETDSHGTVNIHYTGCKALGAFAANSKGDAAETILAPSSWLLCLINSATLEYGIWLEPVGTVIIEVKAAGAKLAVTGGVIGKIVENKKSLQKTLEFKGTKGDPEPKTCTGMDGKVKTVNGTIELNENKKPETGDVVCVEIVFAADKKTEVEIMDGN